MWIYHYISIIDSLMHVSSCCHLPVTGIVHFEDIWEMLLWQSFTGESATIDHVPSSVLIAPWVR